MTVAAALESSRKALIAAGLSVADDISTLKEEQRAGKKAFHFFFFSHSIFSIDFESGVKKKIKANAATLEAALCVVD